MSVAIVSGGMCVQTKEGNYVRPHDWKGFSMWVPLFKENRLIIQGYKNDTSPEGWVRLPDDVEVRIMGGYGVSFLARKKATKKTLSYCLEGVSMLLLRMPSYPVFWTYEEAVKQNIPVLLELHGDWEESCRISARNEGLLRRIFAEFRAIRARQADIRVAGTSLGAVTVGPVLAEKYVPEDKPVLVSTNHTIDESQYRRRERYEINDPPSLLFVGELVERKGLRYFFQSLADIKKVGHQFEVKLVGDGPQKEKLRAFADENGFGDNVHFVGYVPFGESLLEYYRNADIFILPSIAGEGVPRAIHEAMSQGCPVIATDIGSTKWQLQENAGIVIPSCDVGALTTSILKVFDDNESRECMARKAFERSLEFTFEKQTARIAEFVRKYAPENLLQ
ncbi:MAG: glycosyltransferase family 4 protein [Planctomycetes bacterium]|nr:glycosyltransferase family 4 protein [Planctomycetota bacterium]